MNKDKIREFFDGRADRWDDEMVISDEKVRVIMDSCEVSEGKDVLDVATGTGVLIPYYLTRKVKSVSGVDLSARMIEIAAEKYRKEENVSFRCLDVFDLKDEKYDCIMVYNAMPHFESPEALIRHLTSLLKEKGCLTIAHSRSRERINRHHENASEVSRELISMEEMRSIMSGYLHVRECISDEKMYMITGEKR